MLRSSNSGISRCDAFVGGEGSDSAAERRAQATEQALQVMLVDIFPSVTADIDIFPM